MSSSRFLVGIAVAISLLFVDISLAQQAPAPPPVQPQQPQNTNPTNPPPPPPPSPVRAVPLPGDPVPPAQLPNVLKAAAGPNQEAIDAAVKSVCDMMADDTHPATQSACRDWLVLGLTDSNGNPDSAQFLQMYSQSVNDNLLKLVKAPDASIRLKILAGIVAARVGDASLNAETMDLSSQLMKDSSPAVVLVGVKAAAPVLPAAMVSPVFAARAQPFAQEIAKAAIRNSHGPLQGSIVHFAYGALTPLYTYGPRIPGLAPLVSQMLLPVVLDLEGQRLQMYRKGPVGGASEDAAGFVELFDVNVWDAVNAKTQIAILQAFSDLVGLTSHWAQSNDPAAQAGHDDLINSLKLLGNIMAIFANPANGPAPDPGLFTAGQLMEGLGTASPNAQISTSETAMWGSLSAFAKSKGGTGINPAPLVDDVGP